MRVKAKLKTKEEILDELGYFSPSLNEEGMMDRYFGTTFIGDADASDFFESENVYYICGWHWNKKWFHWIKDENDDLIYGNEVNDFIVDIENTINRMVEDL